VSPYDILLPKDQEGLKMMYIMVNERLNNIWLEYTYYVDSLPLLPRTTLIFPILFSELDFYETLLERIRKKIPKDIVDEINNEFPLFDW